MSKLINVNFFFLNIKNIIEGKEKKKIKKIPEALWHQKHKSCHCKRLSAVAAAVAVAPGVSDQVGFLQYLSLPSFKYQTHIPLINNQKNKNKKEEDFLSFFLSFLPTNLPNKDYKREGSILSLLGVVVVVVVGIGVGKKTKFKVAVPPHVADILVSLSKRVVDRE